MQLALKVELIRARTNANEREGHHGQIFAGLSPPDSARAPSTAAVEGPHTHTHTHGSSGAMLAGAGLRVSVITPRPNPTINFP